jgi:hypothetical protein
MTPPRVRAALLVFVLLFSPALAGAQPIDPIGDLLKSAPPAPSQPSDEDDEAGGVDLDLPDAAPNTPSRPGPVSVPGQRVLVDDHNRTPEPPLTSAERGYESRIRAGFNAAENRQGSLEGRWLVRSQAGALYAFQLIDSGSGTLDGAWSDPRRPGALTGSGYIRSASRSTDRLTLSFEAPPHRGAVRLQLRAEPGGQWSGVLSEDGVEVSVRMQPD